MPEPSKYLIFRIGNVRYFVSERDEVLAKSLEQKRDGEALLSISRMVINDMNGTVLKNHWGRSFRENWV